MPLVKVRRGGWPLHFSAIPALLSSLDYNHSSAHDRGTSTSLNTFLAVSQNLISISFGFSVGDFIAVIKLAKDIVSALRSSSAEYHELILELHGLQLVLHQIEHLETRRGQQAAVSAVKVAALTYEHPLKEFGNKLRKFRNLDPSADVRSVNRIKV